MKELIDKYKEFTAEVYEEYKRGIDCYRDAPSQFGPPPVPEYSFQEFMAWLDEPVFPENKEIELTLDEIANKFNIDVKDLRIKE